MRVVGIALALGAASCATADGANVGAVASGAQQAPDFKVDLLDGGQFRLSEHFGKDVVVIDFWTTFCQPCIGALHHLEALYEKKKGSGLVVLGVSMDPPDTASAVGPFVRSHKLTFPVAHDVQSRITDLYNKKSTMPFSVIISRDGRIMKVRESFQPGDEVGMEKDIDLALSVQLRTRFVPAPLPSAPAQRAVRPLVRTLSRVASACSLRALGRRFGPASLAAATLVASAEARADELGKPTVKITETSILLYHFDNRDGVVTNDKYGEWLNRLNVQATSGKFTFGVRLDSALYFAKPDPNALARQEIAKPPLPGEIRDENSLRQKTLQLGRDLSSRFVNTVYPAKFFVSYTRPWVDATVGDFYGQLGRGFVLAVRKVDELGVDTTIRGAKLELHPDVKWGQVAATLMAGVGNPIRVDDPTGRQLTQAPQGVDKALYPLVPGPHQTAYIPDGRPTFATDRLVAGKLEAGVRGVVLGVQGSHLSRETDPIAASFRTGQDANPARNANTQQIASASISVPNIKKHGSFYFEAATERLADPLAPRQRDPADPRTQSATGADAALLSRLSGGHALYGQITAFEGPFTLSLEGKRYNRFYPLVPTVDGNTNEFTLLQYSAVPTTEPFTNDTQFGFFNACVTGGRARLDYRASDEALVFASLGRFITWSERVNTCGAETYTKRNGTPGGVRGMTDAIRNDVWDPYIGFEIQGENARTHAYVTTGARFDSNVLPEQYDGFESKVYYREHYFRYDIVKKLAGRWSIQTAGFHRYRMKFSQTPLPWREGENYLSLLYVPKLTLSFGYEYTTVSGEAVEFFSGSASYRITSDTVVRTFVGQQRQALRCISGVCRVFPAFEGARLELVVRL